MPVITKATKVAARYTGEGGRERCGRCRFFVPSITCNRIVGPVSARGWCKFFSQEMVQLWQPGGDSGAGGGPALDISFTTGTLDSRITFTRASVATFFDVTGTMQTAASNGARFDYDPVTHVSNGLLIEESRTNLLLNSATLGTQSVTTTAQNYTLSFYGTGTVTKSGTATGALVGTGAFPQRVSQTFTPTAGTLTLTVSGSVVNAQLEAGSFATSYIPTTGSTVTRQKDVASLNVNPSAGAPWRTPAAESWAAEFMVYGSKSSAIIGDTASGKLVMYATAAQRLGQWDTAAGVINTANAFTLGTVAKGAVTMTSATGQVCLNAGAIASGNLTNGYASIQSINMLSDSLVADTADGWMRRLRYWPRVLSNAELQQATT